MVTINEGKEGTSNTRIHKLLQKNGSPYDRNNKTPNRAHQKEYKVTMDSYVRKDVSTNSTVNQKTSTWTFRSSKRIDHWNGCIRLHHRRSTDAKRFRRKATTTGIHVQDYKSDRVELYDIRKGNADGDTDCKRMEKILEEKSTKDKDRDRSQKPYLL